MIKVTITRIASVTNQETKNFLVSETPTGLKKKSEYSNSEEVAYDKKYEIQTIDVVQKTEITLLNQEIADETAFNLTAVIRAINNIPVAGN